MNDNINLIAFGTFGNPNGFRQTFFIGNKELSDKIKTFDLNTNAIKLFPESKIYAIRKENINGINSISYSIYNYAKEQNSDRSGTFIGSSILYINEIAEESLSISILIDFNENLLSKNIENDVIQASHSNELSVSKPKDFDKAFFQLKEISNINFIEFSNKFLVVYTDVKFESLKTLFVNSLDLLNVYDSIYFTDSRDVAEFVHKKGMFKLAELAGFEGEIENRANELVKNRELSISNFGDERRRLELDIKKLLTDLNDQLEVNRKKHLDNEAILLESEKNIKRIETYYSQFDEHIQSNVTQIRNGKNLTQIRDLYNVNKRIFVNSINELKQPKLVSTLKNVKPRLISEPAEPKVPTIVDLDDKPNSKTSPRMEWNDRIFKILTILFAILWIGSLSYILWQTENENISQSDEDTISTKIFPDVTEEPIVIEALKPAPNLVLNKTELKTINRQFSSGMTDVELVDLIFRKNPKEIEKFYQDQKGTYLKILKENNKSCFTDNIWVKDSLTFVPSYKD